MMAIRHVSIVALRKGERILLQERRSISKRGEEWGFFGGGIDEGERPEDALAREINEELGLRLRSFSLVGEYEHRYSDLDVHVYFFVADLPNELYEVKEGDSAALFTIAQARELQLVEGDYPLLDMLEEYLCGGAEKKRCRPVAGMAFYRDGKILLQDRRSISKRGEEWGFFGGGIEEGETPEQALVREIDEELGLPVEEFTMIGEYSDMHVHVYMYVAPLPDQDYEVKEGDGAELFLPAQARDLRLSAVSRTLLDAVEVYLQENC